MVDYSILPNEDGESQGFVLPKARAKSKGGMLTDTVVPGQGTILPNAIDMYRSKAADLYKQGGDLYAQEPDYSQFQTFAKQRSEQGEGAMLNALAAQFAGESFAPLQQQYLKKAASAQDPMKMGSGMITADGQYLKDPEAAQTKKAEFLLQQAKAYEQMAVTAQTAQERADAARLAREATAEYRRESMDLRRDLARMSSGNAQATRDSAANGRLATLEDKLADDYRGEIKDQRKIVSTFENLKTTPATAAGDISFIFQYMKMLDPTSVVREGEFATAQNAGSVPDNIYNLYNRAIQGTRLNPAQRTDFLTTAGTLAGNAQKSITGAQQHYGEIAKRRGLDERNIFDRGGQGSVVDFNSLPK